MPDARGSIRSNRSCMIRLKYKEYHTVIMPDETVSDHNLTFTEIEMEFLYTLLDNVSIKGVGAVVITNSILEKVLKNYTPPQNIEPIEPIED